MAEPLIPPGGAPATPSDKAAQDAERAALRLAAIVEWSDDAIISKNLDGIVQSWNRAAERMFGYTAEEAIGSPITLIIPRDRLQEEVMVLSRLRRGEAIHHFETVRQARDGRLLDVSLSVSPIFTASGEVIGASKILRDVTEQKRLRDAADEASRQKDEFLATLSHELRTPLNAVVGYAAMLADGRLVVEQHAKAFEVIQRNADVLHRLVNDILEASRMITGRARLNVQVLVFDRLLREAVEAIGPAARARSLRVSVSSPGGIEISADPDRLRQILWNLLSNAVKFTPPGGEIQVQVIPEDRELVLAVRDTGIGIPAAHLPLIFQRFWQAEPVQSRDHGGLGLGLALVRHFVELHGGTITATSAGKGSGATFQIRLPLQQHAPENGSSLIRQAGSTPG